MSELVAKPITQAELVGFARGSRPANRMVIFELRKRSP